MKRKALMVLAGLLLTMTCLSGCSKSDANNDPPAVKDPNVDVSKVKVPDRK